MNSRKLRLAVALAAVVALSLLTGAGWVSAREPDGAAESAVAPVAAADDVLIFSYTAHFVCQEPVPGDAAFFGAPVPLVRESTDVLVHNPNGAAVIFYKKAVRALPESVPPAEPGAWHQVLLKPDEAMRLDCDEITRLLTGDPAATFLGTYGIGQRVEGFVVIGAGPQTTAAAAATPRYAPLDVAAQYVRGSEVMKKDIHFQPWWSWWWWGLPWRLGYPYERLVPVGPGNVDCRDALVMALVDDAGLLPEPQRTATVDALKAGIDLGPAALPAPDSPPALVTLIGGCNKIYAGAGWFADVDYIVVSNKGRWDLSPLAGAAAPAPIVYPWIPGRWYDLAVVMPQQYSVDLDDYIRNWYSSRWIDTGAPGPAVSEAMVYFFPWWCGSAYWWGWGPTNCINIGVGEGESLNVLQITPARVFMPAGAWPPTAAAGR